ncbi:MAG TPA: AAA family ATPase [Rhodanobacteraceae bacterium]|nr:AAA family ATPase [Rhodanobacteraceae bacterium]
MMDSPAANFSRHLSALGLGRIPFPPTPDASCYFHTPLLEEEMAETVHCVMARKGFVLVTGEIGLGKSTFVRRVTESVIGEGCVVAFILNTFLRGGDLLRAINDDFGIEPGANFADDVARLNAFLVRQRERGRTALIVVDDAQNMCLENLELMRMLSNFETSQEKLVQILLCGQTELVDTLSNPSIRQLASRIVKHVEMRPLALEEARNYVGFRLTAAGSEGRISIAPEALRALHRHSGGNPRRMHLILDRCLYGLVARRTRIITPDLVDGAAAEAGMRVPRARARRRAARWIAGAAVTCLATVVVAATVLTRSGEAPRQALQRLPDAAAATPGVAQAPVAPVATAVPAQPERSANAACLAQFGLDEASGRINAALGSGDIAAVRDVVRSRQPALRVLALPEALAGAVAAPAADACLLHADAPRLLVWRPRIALDDFAFGARGPAIRQLQVDLVRSGHYHYRVDGVVGRRTVLAIANFQRARDLDVTGYPDALTRFVMQQAAGQAAHSSL